MLIMLVDDETEPREIAHQLLQTLGHTVDMFSNPRAAVRYFRFTNKVHDLVITDYHMPNMNGIALATHIQELKPGQRILCVTGAKEDVQRCLKELKQTPPIDKVLGKPYTLFDLETAIAEVCGG